MKYVTKEPITLFDMLKEIYKDSATTTLRNMLKHGQVTVDGQVVVKASHPLAVGQSVVIGKVIREISHSIKILYEDRNFIVINKAEGILSFPLDDKESTNALVLLQEHFHTDQIFAVHRLDKESSGVMLFARGKRSTMLFNEMFKEHNLKRVYIAIVQGTIAEEQGIWESYLLESESYKVHVTSDTSVGKRAITHYRVLRRSKLFSYLELTLETGRKHQIRVHCSEAGHPIAGDKMYGVRACNPISRMCLHSRLLEFKDPFTGKELSFAAPVPFSFTGLGWPT